MDLHRWIPQMTRPLRGGLLAATAVVVTTLLALCPGVLRGETLFLRDLSVFHRPLRRLLLDLISTTEGLPAWNPLSHFGQPFAANPNAAVFDPWSALFLALPFDLAFNLQVLLPLLVGAAGFAFLVRERGGGGFAATFGALSWGLGGCALSVSGFLQLHHAVALLPAALALVLRVVRAPTAAHAASLAVILGLQGLAGSPTGLMLSALFAPFAAWEAWSVGERRAPGRSVLRSLALAGLLGAAIGAATWLPAAALLRETGRVADESFEVEAEGWSLPPVRLFELVAPRALGHVVPEIVDMYWGKGLYGWRRWPYLFSIYGGLAALVLASTALLANRRADRPWVIAGTLGLLLSFGAFLPGWALLLRIVPALGVVRFPEKWAVAPALVLALLAARGFDLILRDERAARTARVLALALAAAIGAVTVPVAISGGASWAELWSVPRWLAGEAAALALQDFAIQFVLAGALVCILFVRRQRSLVLPVLLIALTAVDLTLAGRSLMPTAESARFEEPPAALAPLLTAAEGERTLFQYADWKHHGVRRAGKLVLLEAPVPWQWGIATAFEKDFDATQLAWSRAATSELMVLMAERPDLVGAILERRGVNSVLRPPTENQVKPLELLATRAPRPFVFSAESVIEREVGESLSSATVRGVGRAVVLEPGAESPTVPAPAEIAILERSPTSLEVASRSAGESVLAINSTWARGWRASIDGESVPLLRADGHLSAVVVPAGEHVLLLRYRPPMLRIALLASLLGLIGVLGLLLWRREAFASEPAPSMAE